MIDKKTLITQTALRLFINKGIHAVGINEIIKTAEVAKKTLYHHFATKEQLILASLDYRDTLFIAWMQAHMESKETAQQSIIALFHALDDWFNGRAEQLGEFHGCFFINASAEYKQTDCPINQRCKAHKQKVREIVASFAKQLSDDKQQIDFITDSICILKEGAITSALVQHDLLAGMKAIPLVEILLKSTNQK